MIKRKDLAVYRKAINEALAPVGQEYGLEFSCGNAEFNDYSFVFKLNGIVKSKEVNGEKEMFKQRAVIYGFSPDDYGREFISNGKQYRFIGFNDKARVNCCITLCLEDNKKYVYPSSNIHYLLEKDLSSGNMRSGLGTSETAGQGKQAASQTSASFFVAECMEMYNMGEYHENLSVQKAVEKYNTIPAERMNGIKGIGVVIHTKGQPRAADAHYDLMSLGELDPDIAEYAGKDKPLVLEAYQKLRDYLDENGIDYIVKNTAHQEVP